MYSGKKWGKKHFFRWFDEFSVLRHGNDGEREKEFQSRLATQLAKCGRQYAVAAVSLLFKTIQLATAMTMALMLLSMV